MSMSGWTGKAAVKGSSEVMRMVLLTFGSVGITFTWGIELTYGTPYLLSLGMTKGQTSLVWIAGPLSGLITQPLIGAISDQSRSKWGRRRPVIAIGTMIVTLSLLMLGFTKDIVAYFVEDVEAAKVPIIVVTVIALYATDFSLNAVMSCSRSLMVDTLPVQKQQAGAAWANRMSSIGHICGYGMGAIDLVKLFGTTLGDTQFKQLTVIAALAMSITSGITFWAVSERIPPPARHDPRAPQRRFKVVHQIWSTLSNLPPRIQAICWAVFWSWIGWFPFIIYGSTWVGETYFRYDAPKDVRQSADALGEMGRIGSMALTVYSSVTFVGAWVLPLFVQAPDADSFTPRPPASIAHLVERFNKLKPDLLSVWVWGHFIFSGAMFLTPFATSFRAATAIVAVCGLPWTITHWAPTSFLGVEVNKLSSGAGDPGPSPAYRRLSGGSSVELVRRDHHHQNSSRLERGPDSPGSLAPTGELSGIYFGILNIYTTVPQFLGTMLSAAVFAALDPGKSRELTPEGDAAEPKLPQEDGPNAIAVCLFIGAICSLGAAYSTARLRHIA